MNLVNSNLLNNLLRFRKKYFNKITRKTLILSWTQTPCNVSVDKNNNYFGFGDLLRGAIALHQLSQKYGYDLIVDMQHHPIGKYLDFKPHRFRNLIKEKKEKIPFFYHSEIEDIIIKNKKTVLFFLTNADPFGPLNKKCKLFIKDLLKPSVEFQEDIRNKIVSHNIPENYSIMHFRLGDHHIFQNQSADFSRYSEMIKNHMETNDILISDSKVFKEYVKIQFPDLKILDTEISHIGNSTNDLAIKDTLFEFMLLKNALKIKTYSVYNWTSHFVKIPHLIYDIPVYTM
jgi:hypothetical protein